ncbi:MAG: hypothetical protein QNL99_03100 [SAR86 cluster bacterium]|uniref:Branched-chain amino acid ABC transporter substrate-binding protein n=1 Tax=SAR86 cluster bacterium TaxID=2030880 RepID=A0A972VXN0_9GAMM|nr:hypothetical protein [SAR86 cluster bacterium]
MKTLICALLLLPLICLSLNASASGETMKRVTIGVAGMMKSKTGIT